MPSFTTFFVSALVASSTLFTKVESHMTLKTPKPYGNPDTSPLLQGGTNYPCKSLKNDGNYDANTYAVGADVPLTFSGSASHGGGSCQIALTTDTDPTKTSKWQVIHSIEGGCPVKNSEGNTGSDSYSFKIPDGVAPGKYVLAWTWFNKIGNREMYMNCAAVSITGSKKRNVHDAIEARKAFPLAAKTGSEKRDNSSSSFPELYLANVCGASGCSTTEGTNVLFPNPGQNVDNFANGQKTLLATCACDMASGASAPVSGGSGAGASSGSGANSGSATSSSASSIATSMVATSVATPMASSSSAAGGILSIAISTATIVSTAQPVAASSSAVATGSSSSNGSTTGSTGSCSGTIQCSADGTQFAVCGGPSVVFQAVAPGTKCVGGAIQAA